MIKARVASQRLWSLQRQGRIGTIAPIDGQEAIAVTAAWTFEPEHDWLVPQYRECMGFQRFGSEVLDRFVAWSAGHPQGGHIPEGINVTPPSISLATQIPHAVGMAWALKMQQKPGAVAVFFGDGSSSEGDFYEAANLAGVLKAPVVFICSNNQWAISTPTSKQTAAESFAAKAHAFGFPGVRVDGNDPLALHTALAKARQRALQGEGPTLIEAVTYRLAAHTTADDPTRYVPKEDLEEAHRNDPITRLAQLLTERGQWDDQKHSETETEATELIDAAWDWVSDLELSQHEVLDHVFETDSVRMQRERILLAKQLGGNR